MGTVFERYEIPFIKSLSSLNVVSLNVVVQQDSMSGCQVHSKRNLIWKSFWFDLLTSQEMWEECNGLPGLAVTLSKLTGPLSRSVAWQESP